MNDVYEFDFLSKNIRRMYYEEKNLLNSSGKRSAILSGGVSPLVKGPGPVDGIKGAFALRHRLGFVVLHSPSSGMEKLFPGTLRGNVLSFDQHVFAVFLPTLLS